MKIRNAKLNEISSLISLAKKTPEVLDTQGWVEPEINFRKSLKDNLLIIAEENGKIAGFLMGWFHPDKTSAMIVYTIVSKKFRGRGMGGALIKEFIRRCKTKKITYVDVYAPSFNKRSVKFYNKIGFEKGQAWIYFSKEI